MLDLSNCHEAGLLAVQVQLRNPKYQRVFDEWYNTEHGPARLKISTFSNGFRYKSRDRQPVWLAIYDMDRLSVGSEPHYTTLRENRSSREQMVMKNTLDMLSRRFYRLVSSHGDVVRRAPVILTTTIVVEEANVDKYDQDYSKSLKNVVKKCRGWQRSRRFELVDGPGPSSGRHLYLIVHEFERNEDSSSLDNLRASLASPSASMPYAKQYEPPRLFDFYHEFQASDYCTPPEPGTLRLSTSVARPELKAGAKITWPNEGVYVH